MVWYFFLYVKISKCQRRMDSAVFGAFYDFRLKQFNFCRLVQVWCWLIFYFHLPYFMMHDIESYWIIHTFKWDLHWQFFWNRLLPNGENCPPYFLKGAQVYPSPPNPLNLLFIPATGRFYKLFVGHTFHFWAYFLFVGHTFICWAYFLFVLVWEPAALVLAAFCQVTFNPMKNVI